ncbi:50S ribosomal protein L24 [Candidatus Roizmanbacteria bacterium]|nr:50S ribosomal protein L24 [Candidatus Roizmanbacteria bacterium]
MKLKKGDKIVVITGKYKGKEGVIERVYKNKNKVIVPEINVVKKNVRKNEQMPQGGIISVERPIDVSKLMLKCPKCNKLARIGYLLEGERKIRICKKCQSAI